MLENFDFDSDLRKNPKWQVSSSHTDLPRLREGKVGGQVSLELHIQFCAYNNFVQMLSSGSLTLDVKRITKML